jgi:hypothetical protein
MDQKKKIALYVMLPLVIAVWGYIFFRVFDQIFSDPIFASKQNSKVVDLDKIEPDTFSIVANYRDPFLGSQSNSFNPNKTSTNQQHLKGNNSNSHSTINQKKWPVIEYKGMIKNNNSNQRVAIVIINNNEQIIKQGDVVQDISILKITKEEIKVRFQKETKLISK